MNLLDPPNLFKWAKDKKSRFLYCNDNLAIAAGLDSPSQMIGKTDHNLCWSDRADIYLAMEKLVLQGNNFVNISEPLTTTTGVKTILTTKVQLTNNDGECIGISGANIDITGCKIINCQIHTNLNRIYLGKLFNNECLSKKELSVLKYVVHGYCSKMIAKKLNLSFRTVEGYIERLKRKLQCSHKGDLVEFSINSGLIFYFI